MAVSSGPDYLDTNSENLVVVDYSADHQPFDYRFANSFGYSNWIIITEAPIKIAPPSIEEIITISPESIIIPSIKPVH
uniref:Uncharacterized protein n=1 Tax=Caenorhabditis japonica TaxID=281687 RepID=A0A8R1EDA2_CAEJA